MSCNKNNEIISQSLKSTGFFNDRPYFEVGGYFVIWNNDLKRWEQRTKLTNGDLIAYLESTEIVPLSESKSWIIQNSNLNHVVITQENCPLIDVCLYINDSSLSNGNSNNVFNNYVKLKPSCYVNGKLSYNINDVYQIYFDNSLWKLSSINNLNNVLATLNNGGFYLPIQKINNNLDFSWQIVNNNIKIIDCLTATTCPTIEKYDPLCVTIGCEQTSYIYDKIVNGKPSWKSSDNSSTSVIEFNTSQNRWIITDYFPDNVIYSESTDNIPLSDWRIFGRLAKAEVIVTQGDCNSSKNYIAEATDETCQGKKDGTVRIYDPCSDTTTGYIFSLDNSAYVTSNYFTNVPVGNHIVCASSSTQTQPICKTVTVNAGPTKEIYTLELIEGKQVFLNGGFSNNSFSVRTFFDVKIKNSNGNFINSLPGNTKINVEILIQDLITQYQPNAASTNNQYLLTLNDVAITPTLTTNTEPPIPNNIQGCSPQDSINKSSEVRSYKFEVKNTFQISGYVDNIAVNLPVIESSCLVQRQVENKTSASFGSVSTNCSCCEVNKSDLIEWEGYNVENYLKYAEAVGLTQSAAQA